MCSGSCSACCNKTLDLASKHATSILAPAFLCFSMIFNYKILPTIMCFCGFALRLLGICRLLGKEQGKGKSRGRGRAAAARDLHQPAWILSHHYLPFRAQKKFKN
jgi:hypothetical protein